MEFTVCRLRRVHIRRLVRRVGMLDRATGGVMELSGVRVCEVVRSEGRVGNGQSHSRKSSKCEFFEHGASSFVYKKTVYHKMYLCANVTYFVFKEALIK